jgi:hypothetical protein
LAIALTATPVTDIITVPLDTIPFKRRQRGGAAAAADAPASSDSAVGVAVAAAAICGVACAAAIASEGAEGGARVGPSPFSAAADPLSHEALERAMLSADTNADK